MKRFFSVMLVAALVVGAMLLTACDISEIFKPDAHVHDYSDEVVDPTCVDEGYTIHTCTLCGYTMHDTFVPADGESHSYTKEVIDPTCDEDGYTLHTCEHCNDQYTDKVVPATHTWGAWEELIAPTCTDMGIERHECLNCDASETRPTNSAHHYGEGVVTNPTCNDAGYTTFVCTLCEYVNVVAGAKALGHDLQDWYVHTAQTCTSDGEMRRYCTRCETHYETKVIDRHFYEEITVDSTCDTYGYVGYKCTECGDVSITSHIAPHGHSYVDEWFAVEGAPNLEQRLCQHCGHVEYRTKE